MGFRIVCFCNDCEIVFYHQYNSRHRFHNFSRYLVCVECSTCKPFNRKEKATHKGCVATMDNHQRVRVVKDILYQETGKREFCDVPSRLHTQSAHLAPLDIPTEPRTPSPSKAKQKFRFPKPFQWPSIVKKSFTVKGKIDKMDFEMTFDPK